jgi:5-oxoprolinase (ATP-hydrolysing)
VSSLASSTEALEWHEQGGKEDSPGARTTCRLYADGAWHEAPVVHRRQLGADERMPGPALVTERHSTTVVEPGWAAWLDESGALLLERPTTRR